MSAPPLRPGEVLPVVIVHWNRPERCLATVATFLAQPVPVRPVVVDNGSDPAALQRVRAGLPEGVEVVVTGANLGFGPGANAGFRHVLASDPTCDWVGLAPHDAQPHRDCLTRMLQAANSRPRSGLVSADFGDGATPVVHPFLGGILEPARVSEGWEPAGHPHGTLMLARRALLEQVGLFDERYFAYCEEADLALRAARFGWETGLVRGAIVVNPDLGTKVAAIDYLQLRNTLLLLDDHWGPVQVWFRIAVALVQLGVGLAMPSRRGPYWVASARVRALADHLRGRYGPPPAAYLVH